jgi:hypothetical protein
MVSLLVLRGCEGAAEQRRQAEHSEVAGVDVLAGDLDGRRRRGQREPPRAAKGRRGEHRRQGLPQRAEQRVVHPHHLSAAHHEAGALDGQRLRGQHHQLLRLLDGQRPQGDAVDERERGRVGADRQTQCQDDEEGQRRRAKQAAADDAKTVPDVLHMSPSVLALARQSARWIVGNPWRTSNRNVTESGEDRTNLLPGGPQPRGRADRPAPRTGKGKRRFL